MQKTRHGILFLSLTKILMIYVILEALDLQYVKQFILNKIELFKIFKYIYIYIWVNSTNLPQTYPEVCGNTNEVYDILKPTNLVLKDNFIPNFFSLSLICLCPSPLLSSLSLSLRSLSQKSLFGSFPIPVSSFLSFLINSFFTLLKPTQNYSTPKPHL